MEKGEKKGERKAGTRCGRFLVDEMRKTFAIGIIIYTPAKGRAECLGWVVGRFAPVVLVSSSWFFLFPARIREGITRAEHRFIVEENNLRRRGRK